MTRTVATGSRIVSSAVENNQEHTALLSSEGMFSSDKLQNPTKTTVGQHGRAVHTTCYALSARSPSGSTWSSGSFQEINFQNAKPTETLAST